MCCVTFVICNLFVVFDSPEKHFPFQWEATKRTFIQGNMFGIQTSGIRRSCILSMQFHLVQLNSFLSLHSEVRLRNAAVENDAAAAAPECLPAPTQLSICPKLGLREAGSSVGAGNTGLADLRNWLRSLQAFSLWERNIEEKAGTSIWIASRKVSSQMTHFWRSQSSSENMTYEGIQ